MTRTPDRAGARSALDPGSCYRRSWATAAGLTAGGWAAVAALRSPTVPLLSLSLLLGAGGGLLFVRTPGGTAESIREYAAGGLAVAAVVLVLVGVGHFPAAGLVSAAVLSGSSPALARVIVRR